ncbi:MAG: hypothetical protein U0821_25570 [Chloroflexota bacterium]
MSFSDPVILSNGGDHSLSVSGWNLGTNADTRRHATIGLAHSWDTDAPWETTALVTRCVEVAIASGLPLGFAGVWNPAFSIPLREHASYMGGVPNRDRDPVTGERRSFGPNAFGRYVLGPAWGLWLTAEHIAGLGGIERIRPEAPVWRVDEHPGGVWLQLTEEPLALTEQAMARLEAYLAPLVPTVAQLRAIDPPDQFALPPPATAGEPTVTEADHYHEYQGPGLSPEPGDPPPDGPDVVMYVRLGGEASADAREALDRLVAEWCLWTADCYGEEGACHRMGEVTWTSGWVRFEIRMGLPPVEDFDALHRELGRRLAGWGAWWRLRIIQWVFGEIED